MTRLNLELDAIAAARAQASLTQRALDAGARTVADLQAQLARARRDGADTQELEGALARQQAQQQANHQRKREAVEEITRLSAGLLAGRDPGVMVQALDGALPVSLLPVRIETRYVGDPVQLAIRVYPDAIHVMRHVDGLTAPERERGETYWRARFARDPADGDAPAQTAAAEARAQALWREMLSLYRAPRAAWIVRVLQPTNLDLLGGEAVEPQFPEDIDDVSALSKQPYATVLPDRWCAIGIRSGQQVFRVWSARVPDTLPMGPQLDPDAALADGASKALYGGDRKWLVDFEAAREVGMALVVRAQDLAQGYSFAQGVDRLIVLGVDWTLDENDSAAAVGALLESHHAASDFAFVARGTPTNNTASAASGFDRGAQDQPAPATGGDPQAGARDAVDLLRHALGLPSDALDAANIAHADLADQRVAMHMINALWYATFGRYLSLMLNPWYPAASADAEKNAVDRYVPKPVVSRLREFARRYLRPGGPLPAFRIDKQPYGVLPVVAPGYQPEAGAPAAIARGVHKVVNALRPRWKLSSQKVPRLLDGDLRTATALLQTGPWSRALNVRGIDDPMASYQASPIEGSPEHQSIGNQQTIKAAWTAELLGLFGITKDLPRDAMIDNLMFAGEPRKMIGVPWVQADDKEPKRERAPSLPLARDANGKNYIDAALEALGLPNNQAKGALNAMQSGASLLQQLLAFAAEEEFDRGGIDLLLSADTAAANKPFARTEISQAPPTLVNIEAPLVTESWREIRTTREVAALRVPSVTGRETIEEHVARGVRTAAAANHAVAATGAAQALSDAALALPFYLHSLAELKASLGFLATRTVGELDIALKSTLDAYSYRLDAWFTALATRHMEALREARPQGLYFGGYGWVENLPPPQRQPDSLGYVHAPSLAQAATAAILRSGHLANHEAAQGTFNMDLSSARVHRALGILEGVANGQSLAALLGYRFERALRDALLGEYTLDFRRAFPLRPASDNPADGPQEQIAARDVVDGMKLLAKLDEGLAAVIAAVDARRAAAVPPLAPVTAPHRGAIAGHLEALRQTWDAVSDVLVAEGVYQVAQGNLERAGAALAVLDKQQRPVVPQVTQTPRVGVSYAQRVCVVCESADMDAAWQQASALDPRATVEPLLNAWLARMLGGAGRFEFSARVMRGGVAEGAPLRVGPEQLGWSPLTLALASRAVSGSAQAQHSALRARIAQALAAQVPNPDAQTALAIDAHGSEGKLGLSEFEALATTLGQMIESARPLTRKDVVIPRDEFEAIDVAAGIDEGEFPGVDLAAIEARAAVAIQAMRNYEQALLAAADAPRLALRLADGWMFGVVEAQPPSAPSQSGEDIATADGMQQLKARRERALAQVRAQLEAADALAPDAPAQADARHGTRVQNAIDRIRQCFGRSFPVLPTFTLGAYAAEVSATLDAREGLIAGDELTLPGWLPKLARVRQGTDRLHAALSIHDTLFAPRAVSELKLAQFPYRAGQVWAALPQAWANPENDPDAPRRNAPRLAWVAHAPAALEQIDAQRPLAGLLVDEWQEFVPSAWQTTAVSFHYDAPGSRPPQSVLLALPPRLNEENWTFDALLDCVNEALDLAKLRAVRPQDLVEGLGLMLPANFLPENPNDDMPSVRINELLKQGVAKYSGAIALGKS